MPSSPSAVIARRRLPMSRKKRLLFGFVLILATWLVCELISLAGLSLFFDGRTEVLTAIDRQSRLDTFGPQGGDKPEVLHPFVGFVRRPGGEKSDNEGMGVSDFGYVDTDLPLHTRGPDGIVVAVVGGSVAEQFATSASDLFERELRKSPYFAGKKLVFVRVSLSGYKQPQQLMTIAYLLTLGAEFDLVLNIDGYNEMVLPAVENSPAHVFPSYPRVWQARVVEMTDLTVVRTLGRASYLQGRSQYWAEKFGNQPLRSSPTLNLIWAGLDRMLQEALNREFVTFNLQRAKQHDYAVTGPTIEFASQADYYEHCATVWRRASWQLHQLCAANGIHYYHFLQPNQYLPGSKPLVDPWERLHGYSVVHAGKEHVERGYPLLIREGARLAGEGVHFHDLTNLFADHREVIYADQCCHYNEHGNELLAQKIAELICRDLNGVQ